MVLSSNVMLLWLTSSFTTNLETLTVNLALKNFKDTYIHYFILGY